MGELAAVVLLSCAAFALMVAGWALLFRGLEAFSAWRVRCQARAANRRMLRALHEASSAANRWYLEAYFMMVEDPEDLEGEEWKVSPAADPKAMKRIEAVEAAKRRNALPRRSES